MWKRVLFVLAIAAALTALVGSLAFAASEPDQSTAPVLSVEPDPGIAPAPSPIPYPLAEGRQYLREGIPTPLVDAQTEGWFQYLGGGEFITEAGRAFYWRDGHFANSDGTPMELPASAQAHLNSLGITHQPNAEDRAKAAEMRAASEGQYGIEMARASVNWDPWSGRYLHVGQVSTNYLSVAGNQATITVHDRAPGYAEYYGIGLATVGYPSHQWNVGLEFCDIEGTSTTWVPTLHSIKDGVDQQESYLTFAFATAPAGSAMKTLKMSVKSNYEIWFYLGTTRLTKTGGLNAIAWAAAAVPFTRGESAFEIGWNSTAAPHNPANHHSAISNQRTVGGAWVLQTGSCSKINYTKDWETGVVYNPGAYPTAAWTITPNYDWYGEPN